jgi:hypothetical protein
MAIIIISSLPTDPGPSTLPPEQPKLLASIGFKRCLIQFMQYFTLNSSDIILLDSVYWKLLQSSIHKT